MEEEFGKIITMIKEETLDPEETKKYILVIKRLLEKSYIGIEGQDDEQGLEDFLADYQRDLEFRGNAEKVFEGMFRHCAYKRLISYFKKDRRAFNLIVEEARGNVQLESMSEIIANSDTHQSMVKIVKAIISKKSTAKPEDIFNEIQIQNQFAVEGLRERMINTIHDVVLMLEEYGFIDAYIEEANSELEELGLDKLKYEKRNPIADEQYEVEYDEQGKVKVDKKGNVIKKKVKDAEDIGVIDALSKESLEKLSIEDLILMMAFWECKYLDERMRLSKAMTTIKTLGLWDIILNGELSDIQELDDLKIKGALKKDLAISYLSGENLIITDKMRRQCQSFLEDEGIESDRTLEDDIEETLPEALNLRMATRDIATLEYLSLYLLQTNELKPENWGILQEEQEQQEEESVTVVVESRNFRGPLLMAISKQALQDLLRTDGSDYPIYSKELDKTYCDIMSKIYLPSNKFFNNLIKNSLKENPESQLLANLAGRKIKQGESR